jgi:type III secretion protein F
MGTLRSQSVQSTGGITFNTINSTLNQLVADSENSLSTLLTSISQQANPSSTDMLNLQQALENWTTILESSSTTTKDFYDALKETVQKSS